jgi:hypothetical protein
MKSSQLPVTEYAPSYAVYIQLLEDVNLIEELEYLFMILSNLFKIFPWTNLITATQENGL